MFVFACFCDILILTSLRSRRMKNIGACARERERERVRKPIRVTSCRFYSWRDIILLQCEREGWGVSGKIYESKRGLLHFVSLLVFKIPPPPPPRNIFFQVVASELSLPSCRFRVVASELSLTSCRFQVVASELSREKTGERTGDCQPCLQSWRTVGFLFYLHVRLEFVRFPPFQIMLLQVR